MRKLITLAFYLGIFGAFIGITLLLPANTKEFLGIAKPSHVGPPFLYPDPSLTPGVTNPDITQANISQNICNPNWSTKSIRPASNYTTSLKLRQLPTGVDPRNYEEDHFISLELGGNPNDPKNLWPEDYHTKIGSQEIGAKQKDSVENYLHKQVCAGTITLQEAQKEITQDWYAIFLKMKLSKNFGAIETNDPNDE